jgi:hypothetical protein
MVFRTFVSKKWWTAVDYRREEIREFLREIKGIGCEENMVLAGELYDCI